MRKITLDIGALAPSLKEQLQNQGLSMSPENTERLQMLITACVSLRLHGMIPDGEAHKINQRILRRLVRDLEKEAKAK